MLRRVLPVAGAAALVLVPSSAWAAPDHAPVDQYFAAGYSGTVDVQLPDGRQLTAALFENTAENHRDTRGFLSLQVRKPCVVVPFAGPCVPSASGTADLTGDQVEFDRGLRGASVDDVTLTLTTPAYYLPGSGTPGGLPPGGGFPPPPPPFPPTFTSTGDVAADSYTPPLLPPTYPPPPPIGGVPTGPFTPPVLVPATTAVVTVSLEFTGTGAVDRHAEHTVTDCGADSTGCQSTRITAERTADVTVTLGWQSGESTTADSDAGRLTFGQGVDAAAFLSTGER